MKKVTGLGGVFFKVKDPQKTRDWYREHLGIESESWGAQFHWKATEVSAESDYSVWSPFDENTKYLDPGNASFMINYRVDDLVALLSELKKSNIEQQGEMQSGDFGKFAWILDIDGMKIELWEPPKP